ncbi:hypothetical protein JYK22_27465 [Nonomuraea sp. RK-328]|nr:hypothetical protein [Nonomuraea sp. RK-328]
MTKHTITPPAAPILGEAYACDCGEQLPNRMSAEVHAADTGQCSVCLGSAEEQVAPGFAPGLTRSCTSCAGTGRRREQVIWQLAHTEAEQLITMSVVRDVVTGFDGPFHLSEVADVVRTGLGLQAGRLPVGPRVRDLLLRLQADGEITMLSAPDELLAGTDVVLYRDPQWQRARTLGT